MRTLTAKMGSKKRLYTMSFYSFMSTAEQLKTQGNEIILFDEHDADFDHQEGLEEAPLHDAVMIGVAIKYLQ